MQQKQKKQSDVAVLLSYAGSYKGLTYLGLCLSAAAMVLGMLPYICIWLAVRDLIAAAPDWTEATGISRGRGQMLLRACSAPGGKTGTGQEVSSASGGAKTMTAMIFAVNHH